MIVQGLLSYDQVRALAVGGVTLTVDTKALTATLTPNRYDRKSMEIALVVVSEDAA